MTCSRDSKPWTLTARWIVPVDRPLLPGGQVTIQADRIVAVEAHGTRAINRDWGDVAVLPAFVNAHAHFDLSGLRGRRLTGHDFTSWLRAVIDFRRAQSSESVSLEIERSISESIDHGALLIGDIAAGGASWHALENASLRSVVFYELLGLRAVRAQTVWNDFEAWLGSRPSSAVCRAGVSPHAPYSVRKSLMEAAAQRARKSRLPLAIHLAETPEELRLLSQRDGPMVDFLVKLGAWDETGLVEDLNTSISLTEGLAALSFVHGNCLTDLGHLPSGATVVYCPRTHDFFGRDPYPLDRFLAAGIRVALGTDGLGSAPDLDILADARHVRGRFPGLSAERIVRMLTLSGAEALGWQSETGSITPGKSGDLVAIPLSRIDWEPLADILDGDCDVATVLFRGERIRGGLPVGASD